MGGLQNKIPVRFAHWISVGLGFVSGDWNGGISCADPVGGRFKAKSLFALLTGFLLDQDL